MKDKKEFYEFVEWLNKKSWVKIPIGLVDDYEKHLNWKNSHPFSHERQ